MPIADLRGDVITVTIANLFERASEDFLAVAPTVHVGRVEEIDAQFDGALDCGDGFLVSDARPAVGSAVEHDRPAELPAAQPHLADVPSCFSKCTVNHRALGLPDLPALGKNGGCIVVEALRIKIV